MTDLTLKFKAGQTITQVNGRHDARVIRVSPSRVDISLLTIGVDAGITAEHADDWRVIREAK